MGRIMLGAAMGREYESKLVRTSSPVAARGGSAGSAADRFGEVLRAFTRSTREEPRDGLQRATDRMQEALDALRGASGSSSSGSDTAIDDGEGTFSGYGATFDEHGTSSMSLPSDYTDRIEPGAFERTLAEHKARGTAPAMLWQHHMEQPLGAWISAREDSRGLRMTGMVAVRTDLGRQAWELLRLKPRPGISGLSIGFAVRRAEIDRKASMRRIFDVELFETSLVSIPAIDTARVSDVKHLTTSSRGFAR